MYQHCSAIILSRLNYSDNALIVKAYTDKYGFISLMARGIKGRKSKMALFSPLSILDMVINYNEKKELHYPKEFTIKHHLKKIRSDMNKTSVAFFLAELIQKTSAGSEKNQRLFDFMENSILFLESTDEPVANFHLIFMLKYAAFLGFGIDNTASASGRYFNPESGIFEPEPLNGNFFNERLSSILSRLLEENYSGMNSVRINNFERNELLDRILEFYYLHDETMGKLKSREVLSAIFE